MYCKMWLVVSIAVLWSSSSFAITPEELAAKKTIMLERHLKLREISSPTVLNAMQKVAREKFVLPEDQPYSYADRPLPIGHGQTISQPYIVAFMTELLNLDEHSKVLEIGTGSGYQAAILAEITDSVFTIEIIEPLYERSTALFEHLGYTNITTKLDDGYMGWEEHGLYDAIIVTCAAKSIPPPLVKQLKIGGKICIPVGPAFTVQILYVVTRISETEYQTKSISYVKFVPLTRSYER